MNVWVVTEYQHENADDPTDITDQTIAVVVATEALANQYIDFRRHRLRSTFGKEQFTVVNRLDGDDR